MARFTDMSGRVWKPQIDATTASKLAKTLGVGPRDGREIFFGHLFADTVAHVNALYLACENVAVARGVTDAAFAGVVAPVLEGATAALIVAFKDYERLPESRR